MPINVRWDNTTHTTIQWDYESEWSWQDSTQAAEKTRIIRQEHDDVPLVAVVLNMDTVHTIPRDSLRNMRRLLQSVQETDIIILSGSSTAVNVMAAFMRSIFQSAATQIFTTSTLEEAHRLVAQLVGARLSSAPTQPRRSQP